MTPRRVDRRIGLDGTIIEVVEVDGVLQVEHRPVGAGAAARFAPADDPALVGLGPLLDPPRCARLLGAALGRPVPVRTATLVRYRAGRRGTVRIDLDDPVVPVVYAKAFHDRNKAAATARSLVHLGAQLTAGVPLRLPDLLGHDDDTAVVVLGAVDGVPLDLPAPLGAATPDGADASFRRFGQAVGVLHELDHGPLPARPVVTDLDKTTIRVGRIPDGPLRQRFDRWLAAVLDGEPSSAVDGDQVAVHGDCKPAQVLLGATVGLLDPDHLGVGDPAGDLAQLHVSLVQAAVRSGDPAAHGVAAVLAEAFDQGYQSVRGDAALGAVDRVRWFEQLTLLRKAVRADAREPGTPLAFALAEAADALR